MYLILFVNLSNHPFQLTFNRDQPFAHYIHMASTDFAEAKRRFMYVDIYPFIHSSQAIHPSLLILYLSFILYLSTSLSIDLSFYLIHPSEGVVANHERPRIPSAFVGTQLAAVLQSCWNPVSEKRYVYLNILVSIIARD